MQRALPMLHDSCPMGGCSIALIPCPVVHWILIMGFYYEVIPVCFSQDGGCCNGEIETIPLDDSLVRYLFIWFEVVAIYNNEAEFLFQLVQGHMHRKDGGLEDIDFIDLQIVQASDCEVDGVSLDIFPDGIAGFFI